MPDFNFKDIAREAIEERNKKISERTKGKFNRPINEITGATNPISPFDVLSYDMYEAYKKEGWNLRDLPSNLEKARYDAFKGEYGKRAFKQFFSSFAEGAIKEAKSWGFLFGVDQIESELKYYEDLAKIDSGGSLNEIYLDPTKNKRWQANYIRQQLAGLGTTVGIVAENLAEAIILSGVGKATAALAKAAKTSKLANIGKIGSKVSKALGAETSYATSEARRTLYGTGRATARNQKELIGVGKINALATTFNDVKNLASVTARGTLDGIRNAHLNAQFTKEETYNDLVASGVDEERALELANEAAKTAFNNEALISSVMNTFQTGIYTAMVRNGSRAWRQGLRNGTLQNIGKKNATRFNKIIESKPYKYLYSPVHEGLEEIMEDSLAMSGKQEMYLKHKDELDEFGVNLYANRDDLWDSFIGGLLGGYIIEGGTKGMYKAFNHITGRTKREQEQREKYETFKKNEQPNFFKGLKSQIETKQAISKLDDTYKMHEKIDDVEYDGNNPGLYEQKYKEKRAAMESQMRGRTWLENALGHFKTAIHLNLNESADSVADYTGDMIKTQMRELERLQTIQDVFGEDKTKLTKIIEIKELDEKIREKELSGEDATAEKNQRENILQELDAETEEAYDSFNSLLNVGIINQIEIDGDVSYTLNGEELNNYKELYENFIALATSLAEDFTAFYNTHSNDVRKAIKYANLRSEAAINEIYSEVTDENLIKAGEKLFAEFMNMAGNDNLFDGKRYDRHTGIEINESNNNTNISDEDVKAEKSNLRKQRVFLLEFLKSINKNHQYDGLIERIEMIIANDANMSVKRDDTGRFDMSTSDLSFDKKYVSGFRRKKGILTNMDFKRSARAFNEFMDNGSKAILAEYESYRQEYASLGFNEDKSVKELNMALDKSMPLLKLYRLLYEKESGGVDETLNEALISKLTPSQVEYLVEAAKNGDAEFDIAYNALFDEVGKLITNVDKEELIERNEARQKEITSEIERISSELLKNFNKRVRVILNEIKKLKSSIEKNKEKIDDNNEEISSIKIEMDEKSSKIISNNNETINLYKNKEDNSKLLDELNRLKKEFLDNYEFILSDEEFEQLVEQVKSLGLTKEQIKEVSEENTIIFDKKKIKKLLKQKGDQKRKTIDEDKHAVFEHDFRKTNRNNIEYSEELIEKIITLEELYNANQAEIERQELLEKETRKLEKEIQDLEKKIEKISKENIEIDEKISKDNEKLEKKLEDKEAAYKRFKKENDYNIKLLSRYSKEKSIIRARRELLELNNEDTISKVRTDASTSIDENKKRIRSIQTEIESLNNSKNARIDELQRDFDDFVERSIQELENRKDEIEREIDILINNEPDNVQIENLSNEHDLIVEKIDYLNHLSEPNYLRNGSKFKLLKKDVRKEFKAFIDSKRAFEKDERIKEIKRNLSEKRSEIAQLEQENSILERKLHFGEDYINEIEREINNTHFNGNGKYNWAYRISDDPNEHSSSQMFNILYKLTGTLSEIDAVQRYNEQLYEQAEMMKDYGSQLVFNIQEKVDELIGMTRNDDTESVSHKRRVLRQWMNLESKLTRWKRHYSLQNDMVSYRIIDDELKGVLFYKEIARHGYEAAIKRREEVEASNKREKERKKEEKEKRKNKKKNATQMEELVESQQEEQRMREDDRQDSQTTQQDQDDSVGAEPTHDFSQSKIIVTKKAKDFDRNLFTEINEDELSAYNFIDNEKNEYDCYLAFRFKVEEDLDNDTTYEINGVKCVLFGLDSVKKGTDVVIALHDKDNIVFGTIQSIDINDVNDSVSPEEKINDILNSIQAANKNGKAKQYKQQKRLETKEMIKNIMDIILKDSINMFGDFNTDTKMKLTELGLSTNEISMLENVINSYFTFIKDCNTIEECASKLIHTDYLGLDKNNPKLINLFKQLVEYYYDGNKDLFDVIKTIGEQNGKTVIISTNNEGLKSVQTFSKRKESKKLTDKTRDARGGFTVNEDRSFKSDTSINLLQFIGVENMKLQTSMTYNGSPVNVNFKRVSELKAGDVVTTNTKYDLSNDDDVIEILKDQKKYENLKTAQNELILKQVIETKFKKSIDSVIKEYKTYDEAKKTEIRNLIIDYSVIPIYYDNDIIGFIPSTTYYDKDNTRGYNYGNEITYDAKDQKAHEERVEEIQKKFRDIREKAFNGGVSLKVKENKKHTSLAKTTGSEELILEDPKSDIKDVFEKVNDETENTRILLKKNVGIIIDKDTDQSESIIESFYPEIKGLQKRSSNGFVEELNERNMEGYDLEKECKEIYDHSLNVLKKMFIAILAERAKQDRQEVVEFLNTYNGIKESLNIDNVDEFINNIQNVTFNAMYSENRNNLFIISKSIYRNIENNNGETFKINSRYFNQLLFCSTDALDEGKRIYPNTANNDGTYFFKFFSSRDGSDTISTNDDTINIRKDDLSELFQKMVINSSESLRTCAIDYGNIFAEDDRFNKQKRVTTLTYTIKKNFAETSYEPVSINMLTLQGILKKNTSIPKSVDIGNGEKTLYPESIITFEDSEQKNDTGNTNNDTLHNFDPNVFNDEVKQPGDSTQGTTQTPTSDSISEDYSPIQKNFLSRLTILKKQSSKNNESLKDNTSGSRIIVTATQKNDRTELLPSLEQEYLIDGFTMEEQYTLCRSILGEVLRDKETLNDIVKNGLNIRKIVIKCVDRLKNFRESTSFMNAKQDLITIASYFILCEDKVITSKYQITRENDFSKALEKYGMEDFEEEIRNSIEEMLKDDQIKALSKLSKEDKQKELKPLVEFFNNAKQVFDSVNSITSQGAINKLFAKDFKDGKVVIGTMQLVIRDMLKENITIKEAEDLDRIIEEADIEKVNDFITGHNESYETPLIDSFSTALRCVLGSIRKMNPDGSLNFQDSNIIQRGYGDSQEMAEYENIEYVLNFLRSIGARCGYTWTGLLSELRKEVDNRSEYAHIAEQMISLFSSKDIVNLQLRQELMHKIICSEVGFMYLYDSYVSNTRIVEIESNINANSVWKRKALMRQYIVNRHKFITLKGDEHTIYFNPDFIENIDNKIEKIRKETNEISRCKQIQILMDEIYGYKFHINTIRNHKPVFNSLISNIESIFEYYKNIPLYVGVRENDKNFKEKIMFIDSFRIKEEGGKSFRFSSYLNSALEFDALYNLRGFEAQTIVNGTNAQSTTDRAFPNKQIIDLKDKNSEYRKYIDEHFLKDNPDGISMIQYPQLLSFITGKDQLFRMDQGRVSLSAYVRGVQGSDKITKTAALTNTAIEAGFHQTCKKGISKQSFLMKRFNSMEGDAVQMEFYFRDGFIFDFTNSNKQMQSYIEIPKIVLDSNSDQKINIEKYIEYVTMVALDNELLRIERLKKANLLKPHEHLIGLMPEMNLIEFKIGNTNYDLESFLRVCTYEDMQKLKGKVYDHIFAKAKEITKEYIKEEISTLIGDVSIDDNGYVEADIEKMKKSDWCRASIFNVDDDGTITLDVFNRKYKGLLYDRNVKNDFVMDEDPEFDERNGEQVSENFIVFAAADQVINNLLGKEFLMQTMYGGWTPYYKGSFDFETKKIGEKKQLLEALFYESGRNLNKRCSGIYSAGRNMDFSGLTEKYHGRDKEWGGKDHDKFGYLMLDETEHTSLYAEYYIRMHYKDIYEKKKDNKFINKEKTDLLLIICNSSNQNHVEEAKKRLERDYSISLGRNYKKNASKELKKIYPNISDYFWINSTDGAEWCTWREFLDCNFVEGKMTDEEYILRNKIYSKLSEGKDLTDEELKQLASTLNAKKPVYFGQDFREGNVATDVLFVKSAMMPLLPQFTKGTKLDGVRKTLEKYEKEKKMNCHLTFMSAVKVGSPQNTSLTLDKLMELDEKDSLSEDDISLLDTCMVVGDRKYFSIQMETENHLDKSIDDANENLANNVLNKLMRYLEHSDVKENTSIQTSNFIKILEQHGVALKYDKNKNTSTEVERNISAIITVLAYKFMHESNEIKRLLYEHNYNDEIRKQLFSSTYSDINSEFIKIINRNGKIKYVYDLNNFEETFTDFCSKYGFTSFNQKEISKLINTLKKMLTAANNNTDEIDLRKIEEIAEKAISDSQLIGIDIIESLTGVDAHTIEATQMAHLLLSSGINKMVDEWSFNIDPNIIFDKNGNLNSDITRILGNISKEQLEHLREGKCNGPILDKLYTHISSRQRIYEMNKLYLQLGLISSENENADGNFVINFDSMKKNDKKRYMKFVKGLREIIIDELMERGVSSNVIKQIGLNNENDFSIPLFFSISSDKIMLLLNSIINKRISKSFLPGTSMYTTNGEQFIKLKDDKDFDKIGNIIWLDKKRKDGKLRPAMANKNGLQEAEIAITSQFTFFNQKTKRYEKINLYETDDDGIFIYIEGKNGEKLRKGEGNTIQLKDSSGNWVNNTDGIFLNETMIDPELFNLMTLRIPTSGHMSGVAAKIVAILPPACGDMIIVPEENIAQFGEDFDIDKRFLYMHNYSYDPQTKSIKMISSNYVSLEKERIDAEIQKLYKDLSSASKSLENAKSNNKKKEISILRRKIKNIQEQIRGKEELIRRLNKKLRENQILDIYLSVFNNPNEDIQRTISSTLGTEILDNTKDMIQGILNENGSGISVIPTIASMKYQQDLRTSAADGGLGVGVWSINVVFSSLLQKHDIRIVDYDENGNKKNITIAIDGLKSDGNISDVKCIRRGDLKQRYKQSVNAGGQNICLDTVKKDVISFINQNKTTINFFTMMSNLGFDTSSAFILKKNGQINGGKKYDAGTIDLASLVCMQPIILAYCMAIDDNNSDTIIKKSRNKVVEEMLLSLGITKDDISLLRVNYDFNQTGFENPILKNFYLDGSRLKYKKGLDISEVTAGELANNISKNINELSDKELELQLKVMSFFNGIDTISQELSDYKKLINASAQGVGKYFLSIRDKVNSLNKMGSTKRFHVDGNNNGIRSLIGDFIEKAKSPHTEEQMVSMGYFSINGCDYYIKPTTIEGYTLLLSIKAEQDIIGNGLDYNNPVLNKIFDIAEGFFEDAGMFETEKDSMRRQLERDIRNYIYCYLGDEELKGSYLGLWDGDIEKERERLIGDFTTEQNLSMTSYQLASSNIADVLQALRYAEIPSIINNKVLRQFVVETDGTIKLERDANTLSDREFESSFISLYNMVEPLYMIDDMGEKHYIKDVDGNNICGRDIALDLISYAFLADDKKGIANWRSLIPQELLEKLGVYEILWKLMKNGELEERLDPDSFFSQFIENNADRLLMSVSFNDLIKIGNSLIPNKNSIYTSDEITFTGELDDLSEIRTELGIEKTKTNQASDTNFKKYFIAYDKKNRKKYLCKFKKYYEDEGKGYCTYEMKELNSRKKSGKNTYNPYIVEVTDTKRKSPNRASVRKSVPNSVSDNSIDILKEVVSKHEMGKILSPILESMKSVGWMKVGLYNSSTNNPNNNPNVAIGDNAAYWISDKGKQASYILLNNDVINNMYTDENARKIVVEETIHMMINSYISHYYTESNGNIILRNPNDKDTPVKLQMSMELFNKIKKYYNENKNGKLKDIKITINTGTETKEVSIFSEENNYHEQFDHIFSEKDSLHQFKEFLAACIVSDESFVKLIQSFENETENKSIIRNMLGKIAQILKDLFNKITGNSRVIKIANTEIVDLIENLYGDNPNKKTDADIRKFLAENEYRVAFNYDLKEELMKHSELNKAMKDEDERKGIKKSEWGKAIAPTQRRISFDQKKDNTSLGNITDEYIRNFIELMNDNGNLAEIIKKLKEKNITVPSIFKKDNDEIDTDVLQEIWNVFNAFKNQGIHAKSIMIGSELYLLGKKKYRMNDGTLVSLKGIPDIVVIDDVNNVYVIDIKTRKINEENAPKIPKIISDPNDFAETLFQQAIYRDILKDVFNIGNNMISSFVYEIEYYRDSDTKKNTFLHSRLVNLTDQINLLYDFKENESLSFFDSRTSNNNTQLNIQNDISGTDQNIEDKIKKSMTSSSKQVHKIIGC